MARGLTRGGRYSGLVEGHGWPAVGLALRMAYVDVRLRFS